MNATDFAARVYLMELLGCIPWFWWSSHPRNYADSYSLVVCDVFNEGALL